MKKLNNRGIAATEAFILMFVQFVGPMVFGATVGRDALVKESNDKEVTVQVANRGNFSEGEMNSGVSLASK